MQEELLRELEEEEEEEEEEDADATLGRQRGSGKGKRKRKGNKGSGGKKSKNAKKIVWTAEGEPPVATREPTLRIVGLSLIAISLDLQHRLANFIVSVQEETPLSSQQPISCSPPSGFAVAMTRCAVLEAHQVKNDFDLMLSYVSAAFYIQWRRTTTVPQGTRPPSYAALANEVAHRSVTADAIQNWYKAGTRLIYLAAASSMYIIPMIAIAGLKRLICKEDNVEVIQRMAYLLCVPHDENHEHALSRDCGILTRTLVIPQMVFIQQVTTQLKGAFSLEFPPDSSGVSEIIPFHEIDRMSAKLRLFDCSYFKLPPPSPCWAALKNPLLAPSLPLSLDNLNLTEDCVAEQIIIRTELNLKETLCPVTPANSVPWTEVERGKASVAPVAESIEDLRARFKKLHAGGKREEDGYVCIPSEICEGNVLTLRDANDELLAMLITNISKTLPHLDATAIPLISAVMTGEVYPVDSDQPDFKYCASHKVFWNRYAEQGHDAPKDVHPNLVHKLGVDHINYTQRAPHPSEEMKEDPPETNLLADFLKFVTIIIEFHLRKYLPNEHADISVYATRLPLNERSIAHPFGGFVINVRVCTRGHRDGGDKLFCVVIPFGDWTGGELVMYEPGCVFRPRSWDAIIFPSSRITHFNLHFEGVRLSLVLHSDKYGDRWVQDQNGWASRNIPVAT
ncbi:hypothetical protein DFH09DRAFT_1496685 [Mycena vulgaris]|nr:hypothetical protein DFH09DRAFT_1496685 [Mycena vulgaris]